MSKLPYIPFHPSDYLADTQHLTTIEHGAYLLLLMNYWIKKSPLPDDNKMLSRLTKTTNEQWIEIRQTVEKLFVIEGGLWINPRMERDLEHAKCVSESKKIGAYAALDKRKNKASRRKSKCTSFALITNNKEKIKKDLLKDKRIISRAEVDNLPKSSALGNQFFEMDNSSFAWLFNDKQISLLFNGLSKSGYLGQTRKSKEHLAEEVAFAIFYGVYQKTRPIEKAINSIIKLFELSGWNTPTGYHLNENRSSWQRDNALVDATVPEIT